MMIHGLIRLIFLPLRIAIKLVMLPIHLLQHHIIWVIVLVAAWIIFHKASHYHPQPAMPATNNALPQAPRQAQPAVPGAVPAPPPPPGVSGQEPAQRAPIQIDPVMKRENGDSNFSHDLYAAMSPIEKSYYSQIFYTAMGSVADGTPYSWSQGNIQGTIEPAQTFNNKFGNRCRTFTEVLKVHTVEQQITGIGCQDQTGTWCKLKPTSAPVCGLGGYHPGIFDSLKGLF